MFNLTIDLSELNLITIIFRMVFAIVAGGIIGFDRGIRNEAAGLRTHMLVTLGTTIIMMTNIYMYELYTDANIDPIRMGAYVISGIGFIGAGTDRKSTRLNSSHVAISYAVFCLNKK